MSKISVPSLENRMDEITESISNAQCIFVACLLSFIAMSCTIPIGGFSFLIVLINAFFLCVIIKAKFSIKKLEKELEELREQHESLDKKDKSIESLLELNKITKGRIKILGELYVYLKNNFDNKCKDRESTYFYLDDYFFAKVKAYLLLIKKMQNNYNQKLNDDMIKKISKIEAEIEILANKYYESMTRINKTECEMLLDLVYKTVNVPNAELDSKKALPSFKDQKDENIHKQMTNGMLLALRESLNGIEGEI